MKAIRKGKKAFLPRTLAALVILTLCISPALTSLTAYTDDGAAVAAVAAPAVEAPSAEATDVEAAAVEAEVAPAIEAEAAPAAEATDVEAAAVEAEVAPDVEAEAVEAAEADTGEAVAAENTEEAAVETTAGVAEATAGVAEAAVGEAEAAVTTDQADYQPGETVGIGGEGFAPNSEATVRLLNPDGSVVEWTATADDTGTVNTSYELTNGTEGIYLVEITDGTNSAVTMFTDPVSFMTLLPDGEGDQTELNGNWNWLGLENWEHVADNSNLTYVYNTNNTWKTDLYTLEDPYDDAAPNDPAPSVTSGQTAGVWTNNPEFTVSWLGVSDPGDTNPGTVTVYVKAQVSRSSNSGDQVHTAMSTEGTTYTGADEQLSTSWKTYSTVYAVNPDTGEAWTWDEIEDLQAGVALKEDGSYQSRATQVYVTVEGTVSSGMDGYNMEWDDSSPSGSDDHWVDDQGTGVPLTYTETLDEGSHDFYIYAQDNEGNKSNTVALGTFLIDTTDPNLYKTLDGTVGENGWYISPVDVELWATDWKLLEDTSGVDYIEYQVGSSGATVQVPLSGNQPQGPGVYPDDNPGLSFLCYLLGIPPTDTVQFQIDEEGAITLYHQAYDVAGNDSDAGSSSDNWDDYRVGDSQVIQIDMTDPTLVKDLSGTVGNNGWFRSPVLVTLTAADAASGVQYIKYSTDGGQTWTTDNANPVQFTINTEGTTSLGHETKDVAGHTFVLAPQDVNIDWTQPTLVKDAARTGTSEITVTLTGADALSGVDFIKYSTDGGATWTTVNSNTTTFTITGVGDHNLGHLVFDIAGNEYALADQTLTIDAPGGGGDTGTTGEAVGTVASLLITTEGKLLEDIVITSPDGVSTLNIPAGTWLMNPDGTPVTDIGDFQILPIGGVTAPDGYQLIGSAYQLTPPGITFAPDATLTISYDPAEIPEGSTLVIAYFDETTGTWVELPTTESAPGFLTAPAGGGHTFAIFAK